MNWKSFPMLILVLLPMVILNKPIQPIGAQLAGSLSWNQYTNLSNTTTETRSAMIAANGNYDPNYTVVVFTDNLTGQFNWYFTKSTDAGATWTTPEIAVDPDFDVMEGERYMAAIAMDENGTVHMSFARQKNFGETTPTGIYYARYNGTSWSGPTTIYEDLSASYLLLYANDIVVGANNTVHLAYGSDYPGNDNGDTWYCRSEDGGLTWTSPVNINTFNGMDVGYHPSLAADDSGYLYYAVGGDWYSESLWDEMYFRRSSNNGYNWDSAIVFGGSTVHDDDRDPWITCDNAGRVQAVYAGNSYQTLKFKYSTDHGSSWTPASGGMAIAGGHDYFTELDDYGFIHIIYGNENTGVTETYYMKIDTSGNVIVPSQIVTPNDGYPSSPAGLALTDTKIFVVTTDTKDGNREAYFSGRGHGFDNPCLLQINSSPGNVDFKVNGSIRRTSWMQAYEANTTLDVEMPENWTSDDLSFIWNSWSDTSPNRFRTIVLDSDVTLTGNYVYIPTPPSANFSWYPTYPSANDTVIFDASASKPNGGTIVSYEWNFGDGGTASGVWVYHNFSSGGIYSVTLLVTDSEGLSDLREHDVFVGPYTKPSFPDYVPSGMPDFDQKQDNWMSPTAGWSFCGPVSVANSLWWLDSKYESLLAQYPTPPPTISDHFNLVTNYGPWDDHDKQNVGPLVNELAFLMDTDGQRTGLAHTGTFFKDMQVGISQYLARKGVNPYDCDGDGDADQADIDMIHSIYGASPEDPEWNMACDLNGDNKINFLDANRIYFGFGTVGKFYEHSEEFPRLSWIEEEIYRCEDVVLLLEFWQFDGENWTRWTYEPGGQAGHYVTVAGVNLMSSELFISDPFSDAFEAGNTSGSSPAPHPYPHSADVHNDTQYVSHDAYLAQPWSVLPSPYLSGTSFWELMNYTQANLDWPVSWHAFIRAAVATSPLNIVPTDVKTSKDRCQPMPTVGRGYLTNISATLVNQGVVAQDFNVTVYANSTAVGTTTVTNLAAGGNVTVQVTNWNTTNWAYGDYYLTAMTNDSYQMWTPCPPGCIAVRIVIAGDVNGDGTVNILDSITIGNSFLAKPGDGNWNPNADINGDNVVNILDSIIVGNHFLEHYP